MKIQEGFIACEHKTEPGLKLRAIHGRAAAIIKAEKFANGMRMGNDMSHAFRFSPLLRGWQWQRQGRQCTCACGVWSVDGLRVRDATTHV